MWIESSFQTCTSGRRNLYRSGNPIRKHGQLYSYILPWKARIQSSWKIVNTFFFPHCLPIPATCHSNSCSPDIWGQILFYLYAPKCHLCSQERPIFFHFIHILDPISTCSWKHGCREKNMISHCLKLKGGGFPIF